MCGWLVTISLTGRASQVPMIHIQNDSFEKSTAMRNVSLSINTFSFFFNRKIYIGMSIKKCLCTKWHPFLLTFRFENR